MVVGGGFGGLACARRLLDEPVDITVVDANNFHTFQPLLYQVATAGLAADDVCYAIRGILRPHRRRWASFGRRVEARMARVTGLDLAGRTVELDGSDHMRYDFLVLASGAVAHDFDVPGVAEHAFPLKHLDDALALRGHVLDCFERAATDPVSLADGALDVVVCGGGPTGVEMAGGLRELYNKVLAKDIPHLPVREARITLVEMADRVLTPFTPASSARARRTLERVGVDVRLGVGVDRVAATRVHLDDGSILAAHTTVWATGVTAEGLARLAGTPTGRGGRLVVTPELTLPGHPEVFAVGDIALALGPDGSPLPQVAQPAIQGGKHAARQIARRLAGKPAEPFEYHDKGQMATIGRHDAVTELANGWRFSGPVGWLAWLGLHLVYLMGFRNRLKVFVDWSWNYLTFDRASRILRETERHEAAGRATLEPMSDAG